MKVVFNTLYTVLITAMIGTALLFAATLVPLFGVEVKVVKSGSMEPKIPVGSLVMIHPAAEYHVGDVITFGADTKTQIPTTHRIVATEGEGSSQTFQTKGDANNAPDPKAVYLSGVHGKVFASVPYIGYVLAYARTPWGFGFLVGVPALMIVFEEGLAIIREVARMRRKKKPTASVMSAATAASVAPTRTMSDGVRPRVPVKQVMGAIVVLVLVGGLMLITREGDTKAAYQDVEVSGGNRFSAAAVYPSIVEVDVPVVFRSLTLPDTTEETVTDTPVIDSPFEEPPAEAPPVEEASSAPPTPDPWTDIQLPADEAPAN